MKDKDKAPGVRLISEPRCHPESQESPTATGSPCDSEDRLAMQAFRVAATVYAKEKATTEAEFVQVYKQFFAAMLEHLQSEDSELARAVFEEESDNPAPFLRVVSAVEEE